MTYRIHFAVPQEDGWVLLPVAKPKRPGLLSSLRSRNKTGDKDADITEWAAATAAGLFGPEADPEVLRCQTKILADVASSGRERGLKTAFLWMHKDAGIIAHLELYTFHLTRDDRHVLTLDMLEQVFTRDDTDIAKQEVSRVELPAGPALRRRTEWHSGGVGGRPEDAIVAVTYACLPPQIKHAIVYTMYWVLVDDDPVLTEIADSYAPTLRITT
jgi:hypothetical protein